MNQILLSFLCGAAFLGGAVAVTLLVLMTVVIYSKKGRNEVAAYWKESLEKHGQQLVIHERIAAALEKNSDNPVNSVKKNEDHA